MQITNTNYQAIQTAEQTDQNNQQIHPLNEEISLEIAQTHNDIPTASNSVHQTQQDGVFSNISAKKIYEEIEPPSYNEVQQDSAPSYFEGFLINISNFSYWFG